MAATPGLLDEIDQQERDLQFDGFGPADAWRLGCRARELAEADGLPVVISIELGAQEVFCAALPGSNANNNEWIRRKLAVVRLFDRSSYGVGEQFRVWGQVFATDAGYDPRRYAASGGAFPLRVRGSLVGGIGVSGLPEDEDHALAVRAVRSVLSEG
jgi:uncharacterized protein (UPF0303 family)